MAGPDDDDPSDDIDALLDDGRGKGRRARSSRRHAWLRRERPVRAWKSSDEVDDELETAPTPHTRGRGRPPKSPTYFRARDSLFFEPLVTLAIVVVILVGMYAFTSNWPPAYAIESNSMQHGAGDHVGFLNAGDFVLAQKVATSTIVPYLAAINPTLHESVSTYGEPGDVLIYKANGGTSTPIIHRAILYLDWNATSRTFSAPELSGLPCGGASGAVYSYSGTGGSCAYTNLTSTLTLYHLGWRDDSQPITFNLCLTDLGEHSGFLTLGDNNSYFDQVPSGSCAAGSPISSLVEPGWIIGVARGLLPWFGALKLLLDGNSQLVPAESWELLGLTVAGVILAGAGIHFLLRRMGVQSELRRRERERRPPGDDFVPGVDDDEFEDRPVRTPVRRWDDADDEPKETERTRLSYEERRRRHFVSSTHAGRPHRRPEPPASDESDGT